MKTIHDITRFELSALPHDQGGEWSELLIVPIEEKYEDTEWRLMDIYGCQHVGKQVVPVCLLATGDIITWDTPTPPNVSLPGCGFPMFYMTSGRRLKVAGGGGTIFISIA